MKDNFYKNARWFIVLYLLFAFALMDLNAIHWSIETRWFLVVIFGLVFSVSKAVE